MKEQRKNDIHNAQWNQEKKVRAELNLSEFTGRIKGGPWHEATSHGRGEPEPIEEVVVYQRSDFGRRPIKRVHN